MPRLHAMSASEGASGTWAERGLPFPGTLDNQQSPFAYSLSYSFGSTDRVKVVKSFTIAELFASYGKILWEEGRHKAKREVVFGGDKRDLPQ